MTTLPQSNLETETPTRLDGRNLHDALLEVYRSLIKFERREFEHLHGKQSEDDFIHVLAYAESLRWIDALTRLIIMLDLFEDDLEFSCNASRVVSRKVATMISDAAPHESSFSQHYLKHLKSSEGFADVHSSLLSVLNKFE